MRLAAVLTSLALGACASTPAGLYETDVKEVVTSSKTPASFATCYAESIAGEAQLRSEGEHYWVLRIVMGLPRHRWDFTPTATGSKAELRSTGIAGAGKDKLKACA